MQVTRPLLALRSPNASINETLLLLLLTLLPSCTTTEAAAEEAGYRNEDDDDDDIPHNEVAHRRDPAISAVPSPSVRPLPLLLCFFFLYFFLSVLLCFSAATTGCLGTLRGAEASRFWGFAGF